jgi:predicted DCC family thiol-disulfide oxidoreductase YuxK
MAEPLKPLVIFDGFCNLCAKSVRFILNKDKEHIFTFAPAGSDKLNRYFAGINIPFPENDSIILYENEMFFSESSAFLRIVKRLPLPWKLLYGLIIIPKPIRDFLYRFVAVNRYKWFGKRSACFLPNKNQKRQFL